MGVWGAKPVVSLAEDHSFGCLDLALPEVTCRSIFSCCHGQHWAEHPQGLCIPGGRDDSVQAG